MEPKTVKLMDKEQLKIETLDSLPDLEVRMELKKDLKVLKIDNKLIKFDDLWNLMFLMANEKQQENSIPVKTGRVRYLSQWVTVTATKNIKKGEKIRVKHQMAVDEEMFVTKSGGGILKPEFKDLIN